MLGRSVGLDENELAAISSWEQSELFTAKDRAVLAFTDSLSRDNKVSDELYAELGEHFNETEIMKLCVTVSFAGLVNRVHATFLTDLDEMTLDSVADAPYCLIHTK
jgi:alkylhydroperoxidase family enzyme